MSTKSRILELLEKNRDRYLSGEEIAGILEISRNAVWKAVKSLQKDGYDIKAVTNRGYSLSNDNNILSVEGILPYLSDEKYSEKIVIHRELESTNKTAKEMAISGCSHGTVVIADTQTAGRGRYGRSFYSPSGSGLYMSFVLHSQALNLPDVTLITAAMAVAVCRAIQKVTGIEASIKWVNDILLDNKKVCGILTEAITDFESGNVDWIVTGIGINISTDDFPDGLSHIAASISKNQSDGSVRNRLAAEIINPVLSSNDWVIDKNVYTEYRSRLSLLGNRINVIQPNEMFEALAVDVDELCRLIVKKMDGTVITLSSGEVSIKI